MMKDNKYYIEINENFFKESNPNWSKLSLSEKEIERKNLVNEIDKVLSIKKGAHILFTLSEINLISKHVKITPIANV